MTTSNISEPTFTRSTLVLKFEDPNDELHGLVVRVRRASIDDVLSWNELSDIPEGEHRTHVERVVGLLAPALRSWNLTDDLGQAVPCTAAGLLGQDMTLLGRLLNVWVKASTAVPAPLDDSSNAGDTFPEEWIPMESLSPSPSS